MAGISLDVTDSIEVERGVEQVYDWMSDFTEALKVFPLMKNAREIEKDKKYAFQIGPLGYKNYSAELHFEANMEREENKLVRLVSVPGSGNAEADARISFDGIGKNRTRVTLNMKASTDQKIPKLIPKKMVVSLAEKTVNMGLQQGMKIAKKIIEEKYPAA